MTVTEPSLDRAAWLAWRKTGITATDAAAAVNLSPYASPYSVWASKVGLTDDDIEVTDSMEFGLRAETMLGEWFTDREGLFIVGQQKWCTSAESPWMLATVDGAVVESPHSDPDASIGGFECKTTTDSAKSWDDQIPLHIVAQVQWQMAVTGHQRTWLATLHMGRGVQFRVRVIPRDPVDIAVLYDAGFALWHNHCLTGIAPPTDAHVATSEALRSWEPEPGKTIEADEWMAKLVAEIKHARNVKADAETAIETRTNHLKDAMRDAEILTLGVTDAGKPKVLATWKQSTRRTFVKAAAIAEYPELAEPPFTVEQPTRTFLPK